MPPPLVSLALTSNISSLATFILVLLLVIVAKCLIEKKLKEFSQIRKINTKHIYLKIMNNRQLDRKSAFLDNAPNQRTKLGSSLVHYPKKICMYKMKV